MKSITFNTPGVAPPEKTPLVESEHAAVPQRCELQHCSRRRVVRGRPPRLVGDATDFAGHATRWDRRRRHHILDGDVSLWHAVR